MEPVEMYRVKAVNEYGRVCKRWTYQTTKAFQTQRKKRDFYKGIYTIVYEKLNYTTETWEVRLES